ncbi:uncharacterized protein LOC115989249 isoform X4 [Quercus lobata]|uniref:uncharacterized protein LOC115989249 isoform X4 n=1 Tax=Quercus lobata TaxID=97700 RepID=UPI0012493517|nr:uncharacterized protein LOC115989249 isoform X4 [Quercus lobata]
MQSLLNLHCSYGLPLCVSGIAHHLTLSKEMADHDRRREAIKRQRSQARKELHANQDLGTRGNHERVFGEINEGEGLPPWTTTGAATKEVVKTTTK